MKLDLMNRQIVGLIVFSLITCIIAHTMGVMLAIMFIVGIISYLYLIRMEGTQS